jgi:hypothetical protein
MWTIKHIEKCKFTKRKDIPWYNDAIMLQPYEQPPMSKQLVCIGNIDEKTK